MRSAAGSRLSSTSAGPLDGMSGDLVGPIRGDEHDVLVDQAAREELEQVPRDRVGPVEVLKGDEPTAPPASLPPRWPTN